MGEVLGIVIIPLLLVLLIMLATRKKKEPPASTTGDLKSSMPKGTPTPPKTTSTPKSETGGTSGNTVRGTSRTAASSANANQRSLDEIYAQKNKLWVCKHCETMNEQGIATCRACGSSR